MTDYHPFGWEMPGRKYNSAEYRYGFNGKEKDDDGEFGSITNYDYGFRIYNPAIGKFLSVDPLTKGYPMLTPYQFASNSPIGGLDLDGLEFVGYLPGTQELRKGVTKLKIEKYNYDEEGITVGNVPTFLGNMLISAWNGAVGMTEQVLTPADEILSDGMNNIDVAKEYVSDTPMTQMAEDVKSFAKNPATYEEIAGFIITRKVGKVIRTTGLRIKGGAKWGYNFYSKEGFKSAISHIYDRHSFHKGGKINEVATSLNKKVGVFRKNLNTKEKIQNLVDGAVKNSDKTKWSKPDADGVRTFTHKFKHSIGKTREGNSTSTVKVHIDKNGWIKSAYPAKDSN